MINSTDVKWIGKQFKNNEKSFLDLETVYLGFLKTNERTLLNSRVMKYGQIDEDLQDLIMKNLKKVYSGKFDEKLFCPPFLEKEKEKDNSMYKLLNEIELSKNDEFKELCDQISNKILEKKLYEGNIVLVVAKGKINKDGVFRDIIVSTVCKTKSGEVNFIFKGENKEDKFILQSSLDFKINLSSPIDGFSYPVLTNSTAIREEIIYYSSKSNEVNSIFVNNVLGCDVKFTSKQEKIIFNTILKDVFGGKLSAKDIYSIYNSLDIVDEEVREEEKVIGRIDIEKAIEKLNIEKKIEVLESMQNQLGFDNYDFKISNILPNKQKKSISFTDNDVDIQVKPDALQSLKQIQDEDGQVYLMIPLSENASTNGLTLPIDKVDK